MTKITTAALKYLWPMRHYLVTCGPADSGNIIAASFCMPVSRVPPMVACAIGLATYSYELIQQSGEFVINVPSQDLERQIIYCGVHSGRDVDKFRETGLTAKPAWVVDVPIIGECVAHLECRLEQQLETGDKGLLVARVVEAYADEAVERGAHVDYASGEFPAALYGQV